MTVTTQPSTLPNRKHTIKFILIYLGILADLPAITSWLNVPA